MPKHLFKGSILALVAICLTSLAAKSQCTTTVLDWDYRDFFARDNSTIRTYVSLAQSQNQIYAFGANTLTITHNYSTSNNIRGENSTHTGDAGSFGSGDDVQFIDNGQVSFSFATAVTNLKFSLYDIDRYQNVAFSANNGGSPLNINLATLGSSILTISNNNATNASVAANSSRLCNTSVDGTVNVTIAGPVTNVTITVTNTGIGGSGGCTSYEDGSWWISDITACSAGSFPDDYYVVSRPFTGMPSYVVTVLDNKFYYVDPATGDARYIFTDPSNGNMNSVAYDPYNRLIYYTYSLSGSPGVNPNEKALRRYDMDMDTFGIVVNDASTIGLPIMGQGVESGAAAFYDDHLYWGIEGNSSQYVESIIYRMEMNAAKEPIGFAQVYAQPTRIGTGSRIHDWADFSLTNGILYDFDGGTANSSSGANCDFYHMNLLTGITTQYTPVYNSGSNPVKYIPRQTAIDWENNVYNIGPYAVSGSAEGQISLYDGTDSISGSPVTITENGAILTGSWGDGGDAFRPYCDFGDAPISYEGADPVWGLAVHEQDTLLHLGTGFSKEWLKKGGTSYDDDYDDALAFVPIFSAGFATYLAEASFYNNTGDSATICAWLDFDADGTFEANEGISVNVGSSASLQNVWLSWPATPTTLWTGDSTYLRIRIAKKSRGMTVNDPTGYFYIGEVEDYRVLVDDFPLPVQLMSFDASAIGNSYVELKWKTTHEANIEGYEIQRSRNGVDWEYVSFVASNPDQPENNYAHNDMQPYKGRSMYRLRIKDISGHEKFSEVKTVTLRDEQLNLIISPNPARTGGSISIQAGVTGPANIKLLGMGGQVISSKDVKLTGGNLNFSIDNTLPAGSYVIRLTMGETIVNKKLVITQ